MYNYCRGMYRLRMQNPILDSNEVLIIQDGGTQLASSTHFSLSAIMKEYQWICNNYIEIQWKKTCRLYLLYFGAPDDIIP